MTIGRERYLDDSNRFHVGLGLQTRTGAMHSLLSESPPEVHARLGDILARALDDIASVLAAEVAAAAPPPETSSFGCGT